MAANSQTNHQQVERVLLITLVLNLLVAASKIVIGIISGALAITADGFHSLMDGASNVVGLIALRLAQQPPDEDHHYGHRRIETLAALLIGALLLLTAWEILSNAISRLRQAVEPDITPLVFAVMLGTLVVNIFVSRYERREGRRLQSELLLADAANTGADVFVTCSVLASTLLIKLSGWAWIDPVAAIFVVALIARAAWNILRQTSMVLVDTAPYSAAALTAIVGQVPSVDHVLRARSRGSAGDAYIDIDVQVSPAMTAGQTAAIANAIRDQLNDTLDGVTEVEVHFTPDQEMNASYAQTARACADALGLATHEVHVAETQRGKLLEMHVEVPSGQTLEEAHLQVSRLESDIKRHLDDIQEVVTHIEPAPLGDEGQPPPPERSEQIKRRSLHVLHTNFPDVNWHDLHVYDKDGDLALTMHAALLPDVTIEFAHALAERAEILLRSAIPGLQRVTIHTEPADA